MDQKLLNMKKKPLAEKLSFRKPGVRHATTALMGIPVFMLSAAAFSQDNEAPLELETLQIEERTVDTNPYAEKGAPYKAKISGDRRHVKDLADTPQTISVITQTAIKDSGKTDLRDILASQPGITLGTGENGNAFGDRYIIRGYEARSDVFVDGLRDPGMTTRESFAVEQVEVTKGPSSTFAGRGSTGGAVNGITKQASTEYDFTKVEAGAGTDNFGRVTLDANQRLTDDWAIRINALKSKKDIPDRDPAEKERTGVALSTSYQATEKLDIMADYYYLKGEDVPDLGTYHITDRAIDSHIPSYVQSTDFLDSKVNVSTLRVGYDINDSIRVENATRYGTTKNGYVTTGAKGTVRDTSEPTIALDSRPHTGWQDIEYFTNQLNTFWDTEISDNRHQFIFGAEYSSINVTNGFYDYVNGPTNCVVSGRGGFSPGFCIQDTSGNQIADINHLTNRSITKGGKDSDFSVDTISLSIMDTITFNDHWSLFLGVRVDDFDYDNSVGSTDPEKFSYDDTLWNGHIGVVYNFNEDANVYLTYSTSSNINGGESDVGGSCGYGGLCGDDNQQVKDSEPEDSENIELGAKWNLFGDRLLLTAAVFQVTKDDVMESVGDDDYAATGNLNTGKNRVKGTEISAVGNITEKLSVQFGATAMKAEILDSYNVEDKGKSLANFADNSAYLQLRYQATPDFSFGGAATYSSKSFTGQPDSAEGSYELPSYTVYDLFANYNFTEQLSLRLNVGNLTDKDYYLAGYRSGAFTYIGDRRNAQLTVAYEF